MHDDEIASLLQPELNAGEWLIWSGRPQQGLMLRSGDIFLIPFSLLWGGFACFWLVTAARSGAPTFFVLWGVPFVLAGLYLIAGRFFVDAYQRNKTYYGLTSDRVLIVSQAFRRKVRSFSLRSLPEMTMTLARAGSGNIAFGPSHPYGGWLGHAGWPGSRRYAAPAFEGIPDVRAIYAQIQQAQKDATAGTPRT